MKQLPILCVVLIIGVVQAMMHMYGIDKDNHSKMHQKKNGEGCEQEKRKDKVPKCKNPIDDQRMEMKTQAFQQGQKAMVKCGKNEVIRITSASLKKPGIFGCSDSNAKEDVEEICNGKRICRFNVDTNVFGDECTLPQAKLKIFYECVPALPCPWRGKVFDAFIDGVTNPVYFYNISSDGTKLVLNDTFVDVVTEIVGSFLLVRLEIGLITCIKVDTEQSSNDKIVFRISFATNFTCPTVCNICGVNSALPAGQLIARGSDAVLTEFDESICDIPKGCDVDRESVGLESLPPNIQETAECTDNGMLDFDEEGCE